MPKTTISKSKTISDAAERFSDDDIFYWSGNFHVYDADVYYGDGVIMDAIGEQNSVISFDRGSLKDIFFQNKTPGQTAKVVFVGTIETED